MASHNKNRRELHPAVSISSWLFFALAVELAYPSQLPAFAFLAVFLLGGRGAAQRFARLLWKARWLWLALVLLYAWTVPGTLLWPSDYSPSLEGLQAGLVRVARLALLLAALARLLSEFTPQQLAGGIYLLAKPFGSLGLDRRALAVRLALTLERLEQPGKDRSWLEELKSPFDTFTGPEEMRLSIAQVGLRDMLLLFAAVALLAAAMAGIAA
jgi:energy-coupling factor transporter transmembrane protein EcfT